MTMNASEERRLALLPRFAFKNPDRQAGGAGPRVGMELNSAPPPGKTAAANPHFSQTSVQRKQRTHTAAPPSHRPPPTRARGSEERALLPLQHTGRHAPAPTLKLAEVAVK
ncbi:hypothetical protein SKAU_G00003190 [Synaphobranchus kaupii]|uniref:Uncharacterized protein n=1 Tax=Synaphobranchus kaupii TaxID=118154 RepID=A0A9Q1JAH4_SYNKA|nr:hypothetical protein SKAU_G00003190 [Synaphobranchus kaupii]